MADAVKIPVQLDLQGLDASFNKLANDLEKQCKRVVKKIQKTSQTAMNAVQQASTNTTNTTTRNTRRTTQQATQAVQQSSTRMARATQQATQQATQAAQQANAQIQQSAQQTAQATAQAANTTAQAVNNAQNNVGNTNQRVNNQLGNNTQQTTRLIKKEFIEMSEKVSKTMKSVGEKLTKYITVPLLGAVGASTKLAMDFESAMAKVYTIADKSVIPIQQMSAEIKALSDETGISAEELANNVYDAISAGQKTEDAVNFVSNSAKLAKAGFAEAGQSLDLLTTILNAYGMKASEVGKVSDILINTQNVGKVTVAELSASMGKVIPTAKAMGVNLSQVASGYAIMTSKGIKAAETTTYMNSMLNEMGKSGTVSSKAIKAAFKGKTFQQLMKEGKNLGDVLVGMEKYAKKNKLSLSDMFGSAEAGKAALVLVNNEGKDFTDTLTQMGNVAGATDEAFKTVSNTTAQKFKEAFNKLKNVGIDIANNLLPALTQIAESIAKVSEKFAGLSTEQQQALLKIVGVVIALGPIASMVGKIAGAVAKFGTAFNAASTAATAAATATTTATTATTAATTVGRLAIVRNMGLMGKAVGLLTNPWIAVPAVVGAGALFVVNRTKKLKEELEENLENTTETIMGVQKAYEELAPTVEKATEKVKKANLKIFNGDKQFKADVEATFEGIELYITEGVGDARTLMQNLFNHTIELSPNLTVDEKKSLGNYVTSLMIPMIRAEEYTIEEAKDMEKRLSETLGIELDFKIEIAEADLKVKEAFKELDKTINKEKGLFGFSFDLFGTKKNNIKKQIEEQFGELGKIDVKNLNVSKVVEGLTTSLEQSGMSAKKQKQIFLELGQTLSSSFDNNTAGKIFKELRTEADLSAEEIDTFIQNTVSGFSTLDTEGRNKISNFLMQIPEVKTKTKELLQGNTEVLNVALNENSEMWGAIISDNLKNSKTAGKDIENFGLKMSGILKNMTPEMRASATQWLNDMLGEIERQGGATKEQINNLAGYINEQLGTIDGNTAEVKVETTTAEERLNNITEGLQAFTNNPAYTTEVILSEGTFASTMTKIRTDLDNYAKANPETPIDVNDVVFGDRMVQVMKDIGIYEESNPTTDVDAVVDIAGRKLQQIIGYIETIKKNNSLSVSVNTTTTEKKKVVIEEVKAQATGASLRATTPVVQSLARAISTPITMARDSIVSSSSALSGQIATASSISMPQIRRGTVDKKKLNDASKMVKTKKEQPATIETVINLDGNTIARLLSDKVDMRNGTRFIAKQRRFA